MKTVSDRQGMIAGMTPKLVEGTFVFYATNETDAIADIAPRAIASFAEAEGMSFILPAQAAQALGIKMDAPMRQITLQVYSDLEGVGLTAAVSGALAEAGIACNMVAATHHDHAFVPARLVERAMKVLRDLQNGEPQL